MICAECGKTLVNDEPEYEADGDVLCEECFYTFYTFCEECGHVVPLKRAYWTGDTSCCEDCVEDQTFPGPEIMEATYTRLQSRRAFGIEIEVTSCHNHTINPNKTKWGYKWESTFVSPILKGDQGLEAIDELCEFAKKNEWTIDRSCGLHIHLDTRNESPEQVAKIATVFQQTKNNWSYVWAKATDTNFEIRFPGTLNAPRIKDLVCDLLAFTDCVKP